MVLGKTSINYVNNQALDVSKIKHSQKIECYAGTTSDQVWKAII